MKEECLSKLILFGEASLRHVLSHYARHYHEERNHQGKDNLILFPVEADRIGSAAGTQRLVTRLDRARTRTRNLNMNGLDSDDFN